jgi:inosose dehydratase
MKFQNFSRRNFLKAATVIAGGTAVPTSLVANTGTSALHIAANSFMCTQFYRRDNKNFLDHLDEIKNAGIDGIEPGLGTADEAQTMGEQLRQAGLEMRSVYVPLDFFRGEEEASTALSRVVEMAKTAAKFGTKLLTCNFRSNPEGKTDEEIIRQTKYLDELGRRVSNDGIKLCIHYHLPEWNAAGREMMYTLSQTDPKRVGFCMETHWSYSAGGNSMVAVQAHASTYADRTFSFHFRQSINNVWSETFGDGDIDHAAIVELFKKRGDPLPHISLEQAPHRTTPKTMEAVDVFRKSVEYVRKIFG